MTNRVLFVCTLLVLGNCAIWVAIYFVKQHEQLIADHKLARETHQNAYRSICDAQNATMLEMTKVLTLNQAVLMEVKTELQKLNKNH